MKILVALYMKIICPAVTQPPYSTCMVKTVLDFGLNIKLGRNALVRPIYLIYLASKGL